MTMAETNDGQPASGPRPLPLGVLLFSLFYSFGALVMIAASVLNTAETSRVIAERHGLPDLGVAVPLAVAALGLVIARGLSTLSRWGWWLTVAYLLYFGGVSLALGGLDFLETGNLAQQVFFGNLFWSAVVIVYLLV